MNALQNQIQLIKGSFGPPGVKGELGDTGLPGPMVSHWFNTCTAVHFQIFTIVFPQILEKAWQHKHKYSGLTQSQ